MESGIPVVFLARDGSPVGYAWPADRPTVPFAAELEEFLNRVDWHERYCNWLRAARMRVLNRWRCERERAGNAVPTMVFRDLVRRYVYLEDARASGNVGFRRGALAAIVVGQLSRGCLSPAYWGCGERKLELAHDVTTLLEMSFELELGTLGTAVRADEPAMLAMLSPVIARLPVQCMSILGHFVRWVRETNDIWH
jgi:hypothetical protein